MGVRVVLGLHALVLLGAGVLWFVPLDGRGIISLEPWARGLLIAAGVVAALWHVGELVRKHRSASVSTLALPLLLPAFAGVVVGMSEVPALSRTMASDPDNLALRALVVWAGGAEVAAGIGLGAWASGVLFLAAAVGAAGLLVARGWLVVPRSVLERFALAIALIVASATVRFWSAQPVRVSDVILWAAILSTLGLLLLGGRTGRVTRDGWQSTLLRAAGIMLPVGAVLSLCGWQGVRKHLIITSALSTNHLEQLEVLGESARGIDGVVAALAMAAVAVAAWAMVGSSASPSRRGRLVFVCAGLLWLTVTASLAFARSAGAQRVVQETHATLPLDDIQLPAIAFERYRWLLPGPTAVVPEGAPSRLVVGPGPDGTLELTAEGMAEVRSVVAGAPIPKRDNREEGCVLGRELPGIGMPGARLAVDRGVTLQQLTAGLAPDGATPRVFGLVAYERGAELVDRFPAPWDRALRVAFTTTVPVRVEPSVQRALRGAGEVESAQFVAIPERSGLRVVSFSGIRSKIDELIEPGRRARIGHCRLSPGCNARPCNYVVGVPPDWTMDRMAPLIGLVVHSYGPPMLPAYRAHNVVTLTPDFESVRAFVRNARARPAGGR